MKKFYSFLVVMLFSVVAFAYDAEIDGIYYDFDYESKTAKVTYKSDGMYYIGYKGTEEIIIPEKVTYNSIEYSVTSIGECAFYECKSLTSITIPNSVTSIGERAFIRCSSLPSIIIPNSVTSIGDDAFYSCSSLTSITIPSSVTLIGMSAFEETPWLENQPDGCVYINNSLYVYKGEMPENTHIDVKNGTTQICGLAFYGRSSLASITIPNSVTSIEEMTFAECSSLTSIIIPNSVTSIESYAFAFSSSLSSITMPSSITAISGDAFEGTAWFNNQPDGCVYINNNILYAYKGEMPENTHIDVNEGTTMICEVAFHGCSSLTSISIPNSVTSIGEGAFAYCTSLTSITIPNSVTSIESDAFYSCSSLSSITIPNSITSIGEYAFQSCTSLASITIPNSVTSIGSDAFRSCSSLTSITIPNSVTSIGGSAFNGCTSLTSITIPNSVTSIQNWTFSSCSSLSSITIPNSITSIGECAFNGCTSLTSLTIPNSVTYIGDRAFEDCTSLTSITMSNSVNSIKNSTFSYYKSHPSITIPNSVTIVGGAVFYNCSSLKSVVLSENITSLPNFYDQETKKYYGFFDNCIALASITIPNSVTSIEEKAFSGCSSLASITCLSSTPPKASALEADTENCTLKVPNEAYNDYVQHAYWGQFSNIETLDTNLYKKLEILVNDTLFGCVNVSSGYYCVNNNITIYAIPNEGYEFTQWSDGNTENPRTICITSDTTITAEFRVATTPTPVENTSDNQINIYTTNGTLHIEGVTTNYHIFDAAGRLIYSGNATTLQLPRGIYLVTIKGEVQKIVL